MLVPKQRKTPISSLKQALNKHFETCYTVCELRHDEQHVAMLCNVGKPYSPVTTWLYVAKDETGRHYITKRRTTREDVELMKLLTQ